MLLQSCSGLRPDKTVISLSLTPWVGYYPLYYAIEKQVPGQFAVDLRIVETLVVQDFRRASLKDHIDGIVCSNMELSQINMVLQEPLRYVLATDYSNGADVIVARKEIPDLKALQGRPVGFEWHALGHYIMNAAYRQADIKKPVIVHQNIEQIAAEEAFADGVVDAYVTYPPISTRLLKDPGLHQIFDSSAIPYYVSDVIALKHDRGPEKAELLKQIWFSTLDLIESEPQEYLEFVAKQLHVDVGAAKEALSQIQLIGRGDQEAFKQTGLLKYLQIACAVSKDKEQDCLAALDKLYIDGKSANSLLSDHGARL